MVPVIEAAGGVVLTQCSVTEILLKHRTAVGVKARHAGPASQELKTYRSPVVISDVGVFSH
ncbi:MAG: hypothetical protein ACK5QW_03645 [Cyanobacteriota bacterium]|jgi:phytoene dehydrogenase-like protein